MGGLSKREKIMVIILGIAVVGFLYYNFCLTPQLKKLSAAEDTLKRSKYRLETLQAQQRDLDTLNKEIADLTSKTNDAANSVPDTDRIPELIINLRDMTTSSGCTTGTLTFGSPQGLNVESAGNKNTQQTNQNNGQTKNLPGNVTSGVVIILPMTYQVSGKYTSILSILKLMENSQRKMMVNSITINKGNTGNTGNTSSEESGEVSATIGFNSLYRMMGDPSQPITYPFSNLPLGKVDLFN